MDIIRIALYGRDFIVHNRQFFYMNIRMITIYNEKGDFARIVE